MGTKGVTCKIPLELHRQISEEMQHSGLTMSKFIEQIINEHYAKGATNMATRTMAFQISEELFQKIKAYLARYEEVYHRRLTQKEFVITLVEQALEEAEEEFEAALASDEVDENCEVDDGRGGIEEENAAAEEVTVDGDSGTDQDENPGVSEESVDADEETDSEDEEHNVY